MLFLGLKDLAELKHDLVAGLFVFLIALPLCMGIAMASGFPPVSGLLTAIIGGMIVPWLAGNNAQLTIKGPAAGLIAITISCVNELGQGDLLKGYVCTLAVIVAAGFVQLLLALLRFGRFSDSVPLSVVHGMLAAIGIIIISKQTHVLLAAKVNEPDILKSLAAIPESILNIHPIAGGIGLLSLLILVMLPLIKSKNIKLIPPPLVALAVAVFAAHLFEFDRVRAENLFGKTFALGPEYLVKLPASIASALTFPDFSKFLSITSVKYVVMFALVGSLETMLSAKAIDISDPWKRKSNLSRDLGAVAIGNIICGLTGGLPMISEIARSSANISYGARTARANFFHGFFMLLFITFFPSLLEKIPLSALAAMLVYTGFRLASPKEWLHMYRTGKEQLIVFVVTIVVTLAIDLLAGIFAGIATKLFIELLLGLPLRNIFCAGLRQEINNDTVYLYISGAAVFSNYLNIKKSLQKVSRHQNVVIDLSDCKIIDHTVMQNLSLFKNECEQEGKKCIIAGLDVHRSLSSHPLAVRVKL